jgi:hypothetical protein
MVNTLTDDRNLYARLAERFLVILGAVQHNSIRCPAFYSLRREFTAHNLETITALPVAP